MSRLALYLLGAPHLARDGTPVHLERHRPLALLAYLAITGLTHRRDALAALFWPEHDRTRGRAALRRTLTVLTHALDRDILAVNRDEIGLRGQPGEALTLDAIAFRRALARCRHHGHPETTACPACVEPLEEAAALYRGDFMAGFALRDAPDFDDWQLVQAEAFRQELASALDRLARALAAQGAYDSAIGHALRRLALDPLHEPAHCALMALYAASGQRQAALRQYQACAHILERELGAPPQRGTAALYEAIRSGQDVEPDVPWGHDVLKPHPLPRATEKPAHSQASPERSAGIGVRRRLIGRKRELEIAGALWHQACAGTPQVLLISGEAGIGKTALVEVLAALAEVAGGLVLRAGCSPESDIPYAPVAQLIRAGLEAYPERARSTPASIMSDLFVLAPQLRPRYSSFAVNPTLEPPFERQRVADSVAAWCELLAEPTPLLLIVEDVHWADRGTLTILRSLAGRPPGAPLLLAITYRPSDLLAAEGAGLEEQLRELVEARRATSLTLARLNAEQTGELLATLLPDGPPSPALRDQIFRQTEGNPLFVEELGKALRDRGMPASTALSTGGAAPEELALPPTIQAVILGRIVRLPRQVQELAQMAAILGHEVDVATLRVLAGWGEDALLGALEYAERTQLLRSSLDAGEARVAFGHALIPFALRGQMSALQRQRLHRRAAQAITATRPDDAEALAYHYGAAGDREAAILWSSRAAERARALYAYDVAADYLRTALSLAERGGPAGARPALLEQLGDICRLQDRPTEAIPLYEEALALLRAAAEVMPLTEVRLCRKIGESAVETDDVRGLQPFELAGQTALETGLRLMVGADPHPETVRLLIARSQAAWRHRVPQDWDAAEHDATAAVALAERLGAPQERSLALDGLAVVYAARGRLRERLAITLSRLALSDTPGASTTREHVHLLNEAGQALCDVGEYTQALPYYREAERLASRIHAVDELGRSLLGQGLCAFRLDRWDEVALEKQYEIHCAHPAHRRLSPSCFHLALRAAVHVLRGETGQACALREESVAYMTALVPQERWGRSGHF